MGYGKSNGWTRKKKRPLPEDGDEEAARAPTASEDVPSYVKNTGSQGSANGFGQRRRSGAKVRPTGRSFRL